MTSTVTYATVLLGSALAVLFYIVSRVRNHVHKEDIIPTPTIPRESAVFTSFSSARIRGDADEVFAAVLDFEAYPAWSLYAKYTWNETDAEGLPVVGCAGICQLTVEESISRTIPIRLTTLDRDRRIVSEATTLYPRWLLLSERVQEVVPVEGEPEVCEYRTYHTYEGFAAYYLLLINREEVLDTHRQCASDLKYFFEEKTRSESSRRF